MARPLTLRVPYPCALCKGGVLGVHLRRDRNPELGGSAFEWDVLFRLLQALDVAADGILGHGSRVLQVLALRHESRKGGNRQRVAVMFVSLEEGCIFARLASDFFHLFILGQGPHHVLSFRGPGFGPRNLLFSHAPQSNSRFLTQRGGFGMTRILWLSIQ